MDNKRQIDQRNNEERRMKKKKMMINKKKEKKKKKEQTLASAVSVEMMFERANRESSAIDGLDPEKHSQMA